MGIIIVTGCFCAERFLIQCMAAFCLGWGGKKASQGSKKLISRRNVFFLLKVGKKMELLILFLLQMVF